MPGFLFVESSTLVIPGRALWLWIPGSTLRVAPE
jgi:hypothetical protein